MSSGLRLGVVVGSLVLATAVSGCTALRSVTDGASSSTPSARATAGSPALAALKQLAVKGKAAGTGYQRAEFGQRWADVDRNGCDTRNDILARDLVHPVVKPRTRGCVILSGTLVDRYSGRTISFVRGPVTSEEVQIDHVVALEDAWVTGAWRWTAEKRLRFANDPLELFAVDGALNQQKSASDAASWLPPRKSFRCSYVAQQIAVKRKYGLWVTPAEENAMARVLRTCPEQRVPSSG